MQIRQKIGDEKRKKMRTEMMYERKTEEYGQAEGLQAFNRDSACERGSGNKGTNLRQYIHRCGSH